MHPHRIPLIPVLSRVVSALTMTSPLLTLLSLVLLLPFIASQTTTPYEFCYLISNSNPSWYVANHGLFNVTGSSPVYQIQQSASTRTVVSALGQSHTEQLSGIATANSRVDTSLYIPPSPGYVDGDGIQLTVTSSANTASGQGIMFGYSSTSQPVVFVTSSALGLTTNLNQAINVLSTGGSNYGERIDAGGSTISGSSSSFLVQPYNPSAPITNCSLQLYAPTCLGYPATPPTNSVLFSITLNKAWSAVPLTYLSDLFQALTSSVASTTSYSGLSSYLGFYLFSCFPPLSSLTGANPQVWFFLNAQSAAAMGLNPTTAAASIYALLNSSAALATAGLPSSESGLISSAACPTVYNGGAVAGACSSSSPSSGGGGTTPTTTGGSSTSTSSSSSGLSHGAIAGIVVGSVVGALLILLALLFLCRALRSVDGDNKSAKRMQFQDEPSQRTHAEPSATSAADDTVEMQ